MAKYTVREPEGITYHHSDGRKSFYAVANPRWSGGDGSFLSLQVSLIPQELTAKLNDMQYPPFPKEEETVSNTYHLNDDKNAAIGAVVVAVENMEKTLLSRKLAIAETTRQQDALVAKQSNIIDGKLIEALHEGVSIEDLEEHIPHHGGVLGERVEAVIDITSLDKIAELV